MKKYFGVVLAMLFLLGYPGFCSENLEKAVFAGGCFWCVQSPFDHLPGIVKTVVGYSGGSMVNPTYEQVSAGTSGHYESLEITFNPKKISYKKLLDVYWKNIDPTNPNGQFCDEGPQYRSVIFYQNETQKKLAEQSKQKWLSSGKFKEIYTKILPANAFYPGEEYHQCYYKKNPVRYKLYRTNCGRDETLKKIWGTLR